MHKSKITLALFFCLYHIICIGQIQLDSIEQVLIKKNEYFNLQRETIHLHTNKTLYITEEAIWFKAYIVDNLNHKPFPITKNLYITLYNENGDKIDHKLYLADKGFADGTFVIPKDLNSGNYVLMASTAHQDNFKEDEHYYKKITIENVSQPNIDESTTETQKSYDIQILPEGGNLLEGAINTCGIKIIDQQGVGVQEVNSRLYKQGSEKPLAQVYLNKFGMGKFSFTPLPNQKYYVISNIGDTKIKTEVPKQQSKGVLLKSSFHPTKPLLIVELNTNNITLPTIKNKKFHILVHQYQKNTGLSATFTDQTNSIKLAIPLKDLPYGTNTISLFDENQNPISERLVFNDFPNKSITSEKIKSTIVNDSIITSFKLKSENEIVDNASVSVSILPTETISNTNSGSIINSLYLQPFVKGYVENAGYYFQNTTTRKKQDLDVLLLTQGWSKYDWKRIFNGKMKAVIAHENGITLSGALNITNTVESKLLVNSRENQFTEIISSENDKPLRNFVFENLIFQDSSKVHFALINEKNKVSNANVNASIKSFKPATYNEKAFIIASIPIQNYYSGTNSIDIAPDQKFLKSTEKLEEVFITAKKYRSRGAYWANRDKAYIPEDMKLTENVLTYLGTRRIRIATNNSSFGTQKKFTSNYDVTFLRESIKGTIYYSFTVNGVSKSPHLAGTIYLKDVNAIYLREGFAGSGNTVAGSIYVSWSPSAEIQESVDSILVMNGFQSKKNFYTPKYQSYDNLFFKQYGVLGWSPDIRKNTNNEYEFSFINTQTKEATVFIEGIDQNGHLISEVKIIQIPSNP